MVLLAGLIGAFEGDSLAREGGEPGGDATGASAGGQPKPKKAKKPKKGKQITVTTVTEEEKADPNALFTVGSTNFAAGALKEAMNNFAESAKVGGGKKAWFNAGYCAEQIGELTKAVEFYREAYKLDPDYEAARVHLVRTLKATSKNTEVAAVYKAFLDKHPNDENAKTEYMDALVVAGRFDDAIAIGRDVLKKNAKSAAVYKSLSAMYLSKGQLDLAQIMADKSIEINATDPDVYNNLGVMLLRQGDTPSAVLRFKEAREHDAGHFEANLNLGLIAADSGDWNLAMECFDKALERNSTSNEARIGKAVALRGLGDTDAAFAIYEELISESPQFRTPYYNASAIHLYFTKNYKKATEYLTLLKGNLEVSGPLDPNDEIFKKLAEIEAAVAAEAERKRIEAEKKKAEEERERRAKETLAEMKAKISDMKTKVDTNMACFPEEVGMELQMFVETAAEMISTDDTTMAADLKQLYDSQYGPMLDSAMSGCGGAAPSPEAPTENPAP
jgi:tetratricopeptide (TPR) repeat protein